jgi:hypothetical protein
MTRELGLLKEYLVQLRAQRLQQEHAHALSEPSIARYGYAIGCAHQVIIIEGIIDALKELDSDEAEFIRRYLYLEKQ